MSPIIKPSHSQRRHIHEADCNHDNLEKLTAEQGQRSSPCERCTAALQRLGCWRESCWKTGLDFVVAAAPKLVGAVGVANADTQRSSRLGLDLSRCIGRLGDRTARRRPHAVGCSSPMYVHSSQTQRSYRGYPRTCRYSLNRWDGREKKQEQEEETCVAPPPSTIRAALAKIPVLGAGVRLSLKVPAAAWRPGQGPDPARFQVPFRKATVTSEPPTDFVFGTEEREVRVPLEPQRHPACIPPPFSQIFGYRRGPKLSQ